MEVPRQKLRPRSQHPVSRVVRATGRETFQAGRGYGKTEREQEKRDESEKKTSRKELKVKRDTIYESLRSRDKIK